MIGLGLFGHPLAGTPFGAALELCIVLAATAWLLSVVTRDYSWVDRLWSLCPPVYCLIVAAALGFGAARVNLMTVLACLWGARLTFNAARKGAFRRGGEDYRWAAVRERFGARGFQVFNAIFTPAQMVLIWLFTAPVHQAWRWREAPLGSLDLLATLLFVALLALETVADQQMWAFQQDKKRRLAAGEQGVQPFLSTGLRRCSRHPNYFGEIGMWWVFYLFAVAASGQWLHWTGIGCILLTLQIVGSIGPTEAISTAKYPDYRAYQVATPMLVPFFRLRTKRLR